MPEYVDTHKDEPILGDCPRCRLPIYESDPHRMHALVNGGRKHLYHAGCAILARGQELEAKLPPIVKELRDLGYTVEVKITPPR